jgi:hypothetical protein
MKKILLAALLALLPGIALAQTVTQQPQFVAPRTVVDLGNGPMELMPLTGSGAVFTAQGSGVGSATSSTALTLTATPAVPPCVGCLISGAGITSGTTVAAFNGTTGITLSAAMTVTAATVSWGAACPVSTQAAPALPPQSALMAFLQAGVNDVLSGIPFYTQARLCAYGAHGPGLQVVSFPIGAH